MFGVFVVFVALRNELVIKARRRTTRGTASVWTGTRWRSHEGQWFSETESTQTLTLNLESNNDNPHRAGTKHIQIYNYKVLAHTFYTIVRSHDVFTLAGRKNVTRAGNYWVYETVQAFTLNLNRKEAKPIGPHCSGSGPCSLFDLCSAPARVN